MLCTRCNNKVEAVQYETGEEFACNCQSTLGNDFCQELWREENVKSKCKNS